MSVPDDVRKQLRKQLTSVADELGWMSLSITEKLYDSVLLNPTHAEAQISLRVLTAQELAFVNGPLATVAHMASTYSQGLREALALANLANAAESIIGMLPL